MIALFTVPPTQMMLPPWQIVPPVIHLVVRSVAPGKGITVHEAPEAASAYYVDLTSDEEEGAIIEAQVDSLLGDLEFLFQEQHAALAEDAMEQHAIRKGKAVIMEYEPINSD